MTEHLAFVRAFLRLRLGDEFRARESAADLVQSVCREILANPHRFEYRGATAFRAWLCNAALLKIQEKRRRHFAAKRDVRRDVPGDAAVAEILTSSFAGPVANAIRAEDQVRIERAFDRLTERQREVLTLARIVGLGHREIAAHLGISEANSRTLLRRATAAFAARWEELHPGERG